jgi:hypothetical protein
MCLAATWSNSDEHDRQSKWCALSADRITGPSTAPSKNRLCVLTTDAMHGLITERAGKPQARKRRPLN